MTKEEFLQFRNTGRLDDIAFYYWKEVKPPEYKDLDVEEFKLILNQFIQKFNGGAITTPSREFKLVDASRIRDKMLTYFNEKFQV